MCLCKGTGRVVIDMGWGYHFAPCPDSNCTHDRNAAIKRFEQRAKVVLEELDRLEGVGA